MQYIFDISEQQFFNSESFLCSYFQASLFSSQDFVTTVSSGSPPKTCPLADKTGKKYVTVYANITY